MNNKGVTLSNTIKVYRLDQPPIELPPERCILIDRSRVAEDGQCARKRYIRYHVGGTGYVSPGSNEDLVIGGATHEGLDLLLQGGTLEKAWAVSADYFWENVSYPEYLLPEQQDALGWDGCNLSKAFIYAFNSAYLPQLLDTYEVMEVEEEINWLVCELETPIGEADHIVMMSRPDGVLRHKTTGKLWHVSHKTTQMFTEVQVEKLRMDVQRFSECLAVWAKYGEVPEGTLYNYFLKGKRYQDKDLNIERFSSGLIHPYIQRMGPGGDISPEMLSFIYEWQELDGYLMKTRRLGKGWERVAIYNEMDLELYLNWVENHQVPRGRDYFKESIIGLKEELFDQDHAMRWLTGLAPSEVLWAQKVDQSGGAPPDSNPYLDLAFPLESSICFSWNKPCSYLPICWNRQDIGYLIDEGRLERRVPNHLVEMSKIGEYQ